MALAAGTSAAKPAGAGPKPSAAATAADAAASSEPTAATRAAEASGACRILRNVAFLEAGRREKMDLYLPGNPANQRHAAVVYFHGGGWIHGDKGTPREQEIGVTLATAGYVFASANYRLGDGAWPTLFDDCRNAVRFVRAHAADYAVDPGRIAAMGTSAGAHLALLVAFDASPAAPAAGPYPGVSSRVKAVVDLYGITDLLTRVHVLPDGTPTGSPDDAHSPGMLGAGRTQAPGLWREASPVTHVTAASPPVLIVQGLSDAVVNYGQSVELANVLRDHKVPHELVLLEGVGHMFDFEYANDGRRLPRDLRPMVLDFLARQL